MTEKFWNQTERSIRELPSPSEKGALAKHSWEQGAKHKIISCLYFKEPRYLNQVSYINNIIYILLFNSEPFSFGVVLKELLLEIPKTESNGFLYQALNPVASTILVISLAFLREYRFVFIFIAWERWVKAVLNTNILRKSKCKTG